jgi:hypothetical protein
MKGRLRAVLAMTKWFFSNQAISSLGQTGGDKMSTSEKSAR